MPAIKNNTLNADQRNVVAGGRLPISGSPGQLFVYVMSSLGRFVPAAHAVHQKNAVSARRCSAAGTVSFLMAYASRSAAVSGSLPNRLW